MFRATFAALLLMAAPAWAQTTVQLVTPPAGYGIQDKARNGSGYFPFDQATSSAANWNIVAWSNPANQSYMSPLLNIPTYNGGNLVAQTWIANQNANSIQPMAVSLSLDLQHNTSSQMLIQNGSYNTSNDTTCSQENDLFVFPNSTTYNTAYPNAYSTTATNPTLDKVTAMTVNGQVSLLSASNTTTTPSPCSLNMGSMIYALSFSNTSSGATFYYQLGLNFFYFNGSNATYNSIFSSGVLNENYFFTGAGNEWGIDDPITSYTNPATGSAYTLFQNPGAYNLNLNVYPRIAYLITNGQYGLDTNLSHWKLSGIYYGHTQHGTAYIGSNWSSANFFPTITYNP